MIILQVINPETLSFRFMDVVMLFGGVLTLAGTYFSLRYSIQKIKDDVENKELIFKKEVETWREKHGELLHRVDKAERETSQLEDKLYKKMDETIKAVSELGTKIEGMRNELMQKIYDRK